MMNRLKAPDWLTMKRTLALCLALLMLLTCAFSLAEAGGAPPEKPDGMGEPPEKPDGMGEPPSGGPGGMEGPGGMGGPGGGSSQPDSYAAVITEAEDAAMAGETILSTGTDENAVLVTGGTTTLSDMVITRTSDDSTGGDASSFYGVGAAVLTTGGAVKISGGEIHTDANGGAGVFAYGDGTAWVEDTVITTEKSTSGGIHVAGGGTLYAKNLTVTTQGGSSAAIRSDRGSGTMVVDGGTYTSNGSGSPAVYVTADITVNNALLTATGSEALCLEGLNSVRLYDCELTGMMPDQEQNDNTWTVILYQSMSGDSAVGEGTFEMVGGSLTSFNGGLFYTTNTESRFTLRNVKITAAEDCEYFLRATGNQNRRGWGQSGANGADCVMTCYEQEMNGNIVYDSISNLTVYAMEGSVLTGRWIQDESCAGDGGSGESSLYLDASSSWVVTGDSAVTHLYALGAIRDADGNDVSIVTADGTVLKQGTSEYTVTVSDYEASCDVSGASQTGSFELYRTAF